MGSGKSFRDEGEKVRRSRHATDIDWPVVAMAVSAILRRIMKSPIPFVFTVFRFFAPSFPYYTRLLLYLPLPAH